MTRLDPTYSNHVVILQDRPDQLSDLPQRDDIDPPDVLFARLSFEDALGRPIDVATLSAASTAGSAFRVIDVLPVSGGHEWVLRAFGGQSGFGYPLTLTAPGYAPVLATAVVLRAVGGPVSRLMRLQGLTASGLVSLQAVVDGVTVDLLAGEVLS